MTHNQNLQILTEIEEVADILSGGAKGNMPEPPDKSMIIEMIEQVKRILFSGFFESEGTHSSSCKNKISIMLEELYTNLRTQTSLALRHDSHYKDGNQKEIEKVAMSISRQLISKIPEIQEKLDSDIDAAYEGDPATKSKAEIIISYPGIYAIMVHRVAHELFMLSVPLIPRIMCEHAHSVTGIDIHPGAIIGKSFFMDHGTGIVIGETTQIGNNVKLYQGVTLGAISTKNAKNKRGKKRHPTLEDNVTVYSGASILGGDTVIGEGKTIGGNKFVTESVSKVRMRAQSNNQTIMKGKGEQMNFSTESPELQEYFAEYLERMRKKIAFFQENPRNLEVQAENRPHVQKRFEEIAAMSDDELLQEIEADYFLFVGCMPPSGAPRFWE